MVAVGLMVAGVGLFGTFTGFVASWFLEAPAAQQSNELDEMRRELRALREAIERREPRAD